MTPQKNFYANTNKKTNSYKILKKNTINYKMTYTTKFNNFKINYTFKKIDTTLMKITFAT